MKSIVRLSVIALALSSCGQERSAGGSLETENVYDALVLEVDSIAPPAGRLGLFPVVATVRLDLAKNRFDRLPSDGRGLVVERMDGKPVTFSIQMWAPAEKMARIQVRLEGELLEGGRRFQVRTGGDTSSQSSNTDALWAWIPDTLRTEWSSVLVDNFERAELNNLLPNKSVWFTRKADSATMSVPATVAAGGGRKGKAVSFQYDAPLSRNDFVLLETAIATHPVNFGSLDSIVFWARGTGILSVSLDHLWNEGGSKTWMHDDLDSTWTRWCVRPDDFDKANSVAGNLGWASVHDSITHLTFFATGTGTVMLDDIRIHGLTTEDFK